MGVGSECLIAPQTIFKISNPARSERSDCSDGHGRTLVANAGVDVDGGDALFDLGGVG